MRYKAFQIHAYRGVHEPICFNLEKESIFPLVGVNECGKTTILAAILAFDHTADRQNGGKHLEDPDNLYSLDPLPPKVSAEIGISKEELAECILATQTELPINARKIAGLVVTEKPGERYAENEFYSRFLDRVDSYLAGAKSGNDASDAGVDGDSDEDEDESEEDATLDIPSHTPNTIDQLRKLKRKLRERNRIAALSKEVEAEAEAVTITRHLNEAGRPYTLECGLEIGRNLQSRIAKLIIERLDYILYFDDFRHDVPDRISIDAERPDEWTKILETMFRQAHKDLDIYSLPTLDDRRRKSTISRAERFLNETLTQQWEKFHLEDRKSLTIRLKYFEGPEPQMGFEVVEKADDGNDFYFDIKDRSKGFFWFFNFVMRLEFHPKVETGPGRIVYLLDEPGSYLHARAQDQLCVKLRELARGNTVLYCTHSHHLLDPKVIPFNSIRIVEKDPHKSIRVMSVFDHDTGRRKDAAFQPILEALQVRPGTLDTSRQAVVVVEGLYDFFCFSMFLPDLAIIPAVSAHAIQYHLSWLMAWGVDYRALWDNDEEGRKKFDAARKLFGDHEADLRFRLLPLPKDKKKCRLEDLFTAEDLATMRRLSGVPENAKFEKSVLAAYYSSDRSQIVEEVSNATKRNFQRVKDLLWK